MAYREFHFEKTYAAPNLDGFLDQSTQAITHLFNSIAQQQAQKRSAADQFHYDLNKGAYENDTKILTEVANNVTSRARQELKKNGRVSMDTESMMKQGLGWQQQSANQLERAKQLRQNIVDKGVRDKYYNPEPDLGKIQSATHGEDNDVDFRTRGERLAQAESAVGGPDTFKFHDYRADYVKGIGAQSKELTSGNPNAKTTKYTQRTFWDSKSGAPGVTDDHAIDFLNSDKRVTQHYDQEVNSQLDQEIKKMKASGDSRYSWMSGMSDADIKAELIHDPDKNAINKKDYGTRVREMAKSDLDEADRINTKVSFDSSADKNNSNGRWSNQNILHTDAINSFAQEHKTADGKMEPITTYGPGGVFTQKNGKPMQIETTNPVRTNTNRGLTTRNNKGSLKLNVTGYHLMPVRKGGAPFVLHGSTPDAMIQEIKNIPLSHFDPNGKMALQPEMKIGLNGYTINEAGVLNDVNDQMMSISDQLREANTNHDDQKKASLENMEYTLNELKDMISSGDYDERDLLYAANKAGVRKTKDDWIIPADNSDVATIKNVTGGFNLNDKSFWNEDMKAVEQAYRERAKEAEQKGYGAQEEKQYTIMGKSWPHSAVEKAAKASGMTVDEYLKEVGEQ
jgi:hypothetical protein